MNNSSLIDVRWTRDLGNIFKVRRTFWSLLKKGKTTLGKHFLGVSVYIKEC